MGVEAAILVLWGADGFLIPVGACIARPQSCGFGFMMRDVVGAVPYRGRRDFDEAECRP